MVGTPLERYRNPANIFVAGFIGSPATNFLDVAGKDIVALVDGPTPISNGQTLTVHVLPGHVHVFGRDHGQRLS